ncbi:MAG: hypothetical protein ACPG3V_08890 [Porticoccaceae bacterium]
MVKNILISINSLRKLGSLIALLSVLAGCSASTSIQLDTNFPQVLAQPRPISAAIVFEESFSNYSAAPNQYTSMAIGNAQVELFKNAFTGLFDPVEFVSAEQEIQGQPSLIIRPEVREVQLSTPSENYLNVFEVWVKYNLEIRTADGEVLTTWFMPTYGKTPESSMASKSAAIEKATITAIRDAGAKLHLDFYQIPALKNWLAQHPEQHKQVMNKTPGGVN